MADPQQAQTPTSAPQPSTPPQQTLAQLVKAKYPGSYDDMDDAALEKAVLAKHPEYSDLPRTRPTEAQQVQAGLPGIPKPQVNMQSSNLANVLSGKPLTGMESGLSSPAQDPQNAQAMQKGAAIGSLITNPVATIGSIGGGYLGGKGAKVATQKLGGGERAQDIAELGGNLAGGLAGGLGAVKGVPWAAGKIPSFERAGQNFQEVMGAAKTNPVPVSDELSDSLMQYRKLVDAGGSRSLSVEKLLQRVTSPDKGPLTYEEARDFGSNISRLSADESQRLTPVMKRAVGQIAQNLRSVTADTATQAGKGPQFQSAMKEYSQASTLQDLASRAKDVGIDAFLKAIGLGAGGYAVKKILTK